MVFSSDGKIRLNVHFLATSCMIFLNLRQVPVSVFMVKMAASEPLLRGLLGGFLELVSILVETSKKLKMQYHNKKLFQKVDTDLIL